MVFEYPHNINYVNNFNINNFNSSTNNKQFIDTVPRGYVKQKRWVPNKCKWCNNIHCSCFKEVDEEINQIK